MLRIKTARSYLVGLGVLLLVIAVVIFSVWPRNDKSIVLPNLTGAHSIAIEDDWDGLDSLAPVQAHYLLERTGEQFTGKAHFSVAGYEKPRVAVEDVAIPGETVEEFLKMLAQAPLTENEYIPQASPPTDDYPFAKIQLQLEAETVTFFSQSLGDASRWEVVFAGGGRSPWGVTLKGKDYGIYSARPGEALGALQPYLKKDVLARLIDPKYILPTAVPNPTQNP